MTQQAALLRERLGRLDADQLVKLVTGLQQRIDTLAASVTSDSSTHAIAVVGLGCRFPGAPDVEAFRRLLEQGCNAVADPPPGRPEAARLPVGGYIEGIDRFDPAFFGMRDNEAAYMDPQHRLVLEVAWHALEDAGAADPARRPRATGIFLGISTHDYEARFHRSSEGFGTMATTGNAASAAAGRLAHLLDVTGPALSIDTACSSSLVAVLAACNSLRLGESDMAIAGGVNVLVNDALTRGFAAAGMLSPSHACRTFDASADGYVRGEGAGIVILKRLADAQRDGDRIRAVIRGGAVNHDGRASSLTAPNAGAQTELIRRALADAGLRPADVQVVECHGTGTPLGDPIEVQALAAAYAADRETPLLLGSVKTNIGHLEAAAGIAGVIKTILSLETATLAATLHQSRLNPRLDWATLPVRVIDRPQDWPGQAPRRAGVSSFGFSGTNSHVIFEEALPLPKPKSVAPVVLTLSAPDDDGVRRMAGHLADWLERTEVDMQQVAASLAIGRARFSARAAVTGDDREAIIAGLRDVQAGRLGVGRDLSAGNTDLPQVAFLYTGQGSQWPGMGADLYAHNPVFKNVVDRCAEVVNPLLEMSLVDVLFAEDTTDSLVDTRIAQPALFVLGYALAETLAGWGVVPAMSIGHSLGEWIGACRAGVMTLDDALRLVVERGRLMGAAPGGGAMAAVFAPSATVYALPPETRVGVDLAAENAPDECVIAGPEAAVSRVCDALDEQGVGSQRLRTSHAFHSSMMESVLEPFSRALDGVALSRPISGIVSNVTGTVGAPWDTAAYWVRHIRETVQFTKGVSTLAEHGVSVLIEVGASAALIGTASRADGYRDQAPVLAPTLRRKQPAMRTLANLLAQLFVAGVPVRWDKVYEGTGRTSVPGYAFAGKTFWLSQQDDDTTTLQALSVTAQNSAALVDQAAGRHDQDGAASKDTLTEVINTLARALQLSLRDAGAEVGFLELGVDSLALTEAVAGLERRWSIAIPRRALFEELGTPARLVAHVVDAHTRYMAAKTIDREGGVAVSASDPRPATAIATPMTTALASASAAPKLVIAPETQRGLAEFTQAYVHRSAGSRRERETYGRYLADSRAVAGFRPETKEMLYPIVGASGSGSRITDIDGNEYVDITMGFGVQLFGHSPSFLIDTLNDHLGRRGMFVGPQAHLAGEAAQRLCKLTGNERAAFCNSGTEAVMTALRLARHATGRQRIAMFQGSYHGHFDGTLAQAGLGGKAVPMTEGTPPGMVNDILLLDYGDEAGSLALLEREAHTLAAVIVEPVQSRRPDRQPREFLQRLRTLTASTGTALIFDEVLLGFRVALAGAQAWAGVRADLVTYGKIIGGGLPIGVVAGKAQYLDALDGGAWSFDDSGAPRDHRCFFAGTFNKNPLVMASMHSVMTHLEASGPGLQESLNARTDAFVARLNGILAEEAADIAVHHFASMFRFVGANDVFYNHLIQNGVYVWEGRSCFVSTAHTDDDLLKVEQAVRASVRGMCARHLLVPRRVAPDTSPQPEHLATTPGQAALRLLAAFSPETSGAYNQSLVLDFKGVLNVDALVTAVEHVVGRHEALRSTFPDDGSVQHVHAQLKPTIRIVESIPSEGEVYRDWLDDAVLAPFDLERGPMSRALLLRFSQQSHRLVLVLPHLVTDGWSMQVIAAELAELYSADAEQRSAILPDPVPYRNYIAHAQARAHLPEQAAYWRALYATVPPVLQLPTDRPRPPLQGYVGARASRRPQPQLRAEVEASARRHGTSVFSLCLAAYARLLARISQQDSAAVAIFSAGQPELSESNLVGYCVSVLALPISAGPAVSDTELLVQVRRTVAQAVAHRDYPYSRLLKDLQLRRDASRPPLASVSFNLDRIDALPEFSGLQMQLDANIHSAVRWDLNWNMQLDDDGVRLDVHYNRDLFDRRRVESWIDHYMDILGALCGLAPSGRIAHGNRSCMTLAERVARTAAEQPAAPAVRDRAGTVTYAALDAHAAALALRLRVAGIGQGDRVAFRLNRGLGPVVAMLAAARVGAAFVPLDTLHPDHHHLHVLADSRAKALIIDVGAPTVQAPVTTLQWSRHDEPGGILAPLGAAHADSAYVLYTSGSTGRPKGVQVSIGAVQSYVSAMLERLEACEPTSFAIVSSFAADLGYTSVLGALWSGGLLHVVDDASAQDPVALQAWFSQMPVDVLKIVPAHLSALLDAPNSATLLPRKALILGGDTLTWRVVDRVRNIGAICRIFNHYGPTETTVGACMIEATPSLRSKEATSVPVGRPLRGCQVTIQDPQGRPVPTGEEGEIVISGLTVASGYTQHEPLGKERFGCTHEGIPFYRTGDLGRADAEGVLTFVGRVDDMVKIRGHRIEPAGLSELLRSCPGVRDAVILVLRQENREPSLLAAVATTLSKDEIKSWLGMRVPAAMLPARIETYASLPLSSNGKIDRQTLLSSALTPTDREQDGSSAIRALEAPDDEVGHQADARSTSGDGVAVLCRIWESILQRGSIGPDDDFFSLGGDSIMAIQVVGRARAAGMALTPTQVFQAPTPRRLARLALPVADGISGAQPITAAVPLTPIQHWFHDIPISDRNHWCLSAVFKIAVGTSVQQLEAALHAAINRHDALRMRFCVGVDAPTQQVGDAAGPALLMADGNDLCDVELEAAQDRLANELMSTLDLRQGRNIAAGVIADNEGAAFQLVVVVHHAVFDMVSWSILAEDLDAGLRGNSAELRPSTTSWAWWAQALSIHANNMMDSLSYWSEVAATARTLVPFPMDTQGASNCEGDAGEIQLRISPDRAQPYFERMVAVYGMRAHEALFAAVANAITEWAGASVAIELEGHGRHPFDAGIDLSRTVGWFTTRYPVVVPAEAADDHAWLLEIKETLRGVPDHGMSYGLLRYGEHASITVESPVSFNYVGDLGQFGHAGLPIVRVGAGQERGADAHRSHLLSFDAWQQDGELLLTCRYGPHSADSVDALMRAIDVRLGRFLGICDAASTAAYTPSDFTGIEFSQDELDQLVSELGDQED